MAIDRSSLTPQQRLAISRRALFNQIDSAADSDAEPAEHTRSTATTAAYAEASQGSPSHPSSKKKKRGLLDGLPWLSVAQSFGARWWRRHPANAMVQLAQPLLQRYARKQPGKLIAIAAGTGAVLMLVKPWRLLSVTALAAAVLKTSDVADMVTTLMHGQLATRDDDRT
ncbi:MAG: hypothetical protein EOP71_02130 [Variovorax sp.]|nr:MAG: hypothetical protein EOP71_02130 [Variovorax sp.]